MMDKLVIVEASTAHLKALKWINKATSKDEARPSLTCVFVMEHELFASNGWQLHTAILGENPFPVGAWKIRNIQRDYVVLERREATMPEYQKILADMKHSGIKIENKDGEKFQVDFGVDPAKMMTALDFASHQRGVTVTIGQGAVVISGCMVAKDSSEIPVTAMLMQMFRDNGTAHIIPVKKAEVS